MIDLEYIARMEHANDKNSKSFKGKDTSSTPTSESQFSQSNLPSTTPSPLTKNKVNFSPNIPKKHRLGSTKPSSTDIYLTINTPLNSPMIIE